MILRPYRDAADLAAIGKLAAVSISGDPDCFLLHPGDILHRLFNGMKFEDPAELVTLWEDESGLVAWTAVYARRRSFDAQVRQERRDELERPVLFHAESHLVAEMTRLRIEGEDIRAEADGCDAVRGPTLEALGWSKGEHEYTVTRRSLDQVPSATIPEGFVIRQVRGVEEAAEIAEVHSASFGSEWTPGLYRRVMEAPGYDPRREFVAEAPGGRLAAFTVTWHDHDNRLGLFEPVGSHEEFRRLGLGRAVMVAGMESMKAAGMDAAIVTYELSNPASMALYTSLGFAPIIESVGYSKPLNRGS